MTAKQKLPKATEPVPTSEILSKYKLIDLLNWYNNNEYINLDDLKGYFLAYLKNNQYNESIAKYVSGYNPNLVVARLLFLGWQLEDSTVIKFKNYIKSLDNKFNLEKVKKQEVEEPKKSPVTTTSLDYSECYNQIDMYIDTKFYHRPSFSTTFETQALKINACILYLDKLLLEAEADYENKAYDHVSYKKITNILTELKDVYLKAKNSTVKPVRKVNKSTMVKSVKYQIKKFGTADKFYIPINTVGKKKLFVYDETKKLLICFYSAVGFTYSGTTLKDYTDKSVCTRIKDEAILTNSLSALNDIFTNAKLVKPVPSGRFNESTTILAFS